MRMRRYLKRCDQCGRLFVTLAPAQAWCPTCCEASRVWRTTGDPPERIRAEIEQRKAEARAAKSASLSLSGEHDDEN